MKLLSRANSPVGILIRVLIQRNVKLELAADWEETGQTDRGRGQGTERRQTRGGTDCWKKTLAGVRDEWVNDNTTDRQTVALKQTQT